MKGKITSNGERRNKRKKKTNQVRNPVISHLLEVFLPPLSFLFKQQGGEIEKKKAKQNEKNDFYPCTSRVETGSKTARCRSHSLTVIAGVQQVKRD